jgi:hypothetical protein
MFRDTLARVGARALLALIVLGGSSASLAAARQTASTGLDQWAAVLEQEREPLEAQIDGELSSYTIDAGFTPATADEYARIDGDLTLEWINPADEAANEIYLRLYANDERYRDGATEVDDITIDGEPVDPEFSVNDTLLTLPLDDAIEPGDGVTVEMVFNSIVPNNVVSSYGMFSHDTDTDSYTIDHWFPLLAGYDPANGYELGPLSINGDPVFSNVAFFTVSLATPEEMVVASTGTVADSATDRGTTTTEYVSGPTRNFTLAISEHYTLVEGTAGGTTVRSYYLPGHEERGEISLQWAIDSIELFNGLIGPYPFEQFSVVDAVIGGGAAGIEFPQIVYVASSFYNEPLDDERFPRSHEYTLVHEVLHQWWYGVVGNNQHQHAFLDESLTNYLTVVYFEKIYGEDVAQQQALLNLVAPYLIFLYGIFSSPNDDEVVDTPTDSFSSGDAYGTIVYSKGSLAFQAIREELGDDAFFAALQAYYADQALLIAQPDDLLDAFVEAEPEGVDIVPVWENWIEQANGKTDFPKELAEELLGGLGS